MSECPSRQVLGEFAAGRLAENAAAETGAHVAHCEACREIISETRPTVSAAALGSTPTGHPSRPVNPIAETDRSLTPVVEGCGAGPAAPVVEGWGTSSPTLSLGHSYSFLQPAEHPGDLGRLGPYRVLRVLGEGGMGLVFKAEDPLLERPVALKVMKPEGADETSRKRFLMEGKLAASVRHDHIVAIYQVDDSQGVPYLAMEFLEGEPLDRRLRRDGKQSIAEVLRIGREVAEGLAAAHAKGLVHRDTKPANIWMERVAGKPDRAKILDFGLARGVGDKATHLTRTGVIMGTPDYMAPEQARGTPLDARCDLFSLGCVLYHMVTGRKPFHGDDVMAVLLALATEEPVPLRHINPHIPREVEERIQSLMAKNVNDRPKDAQTVVEELGRLERNLDSLSTSASAPASTPPRPVAPGGLPRTGIRKAPRRTVNPYTSVDELLRDPSSDKTAPSPAPTAKVRPPKPSGATGPTTPMAPDELSPWSGEVPQASPKPRPARPPADVTATLSQPVAPAREVPRAIPVRKGIDPSIPLTGKCPKCGSGRYGKSSLGWCQVCGFSVGGPAAQDGIAAIQDRYRTEQSMTWVWTVLLGSVAIFAATLAASHFVPRGSDAWNRWVWLQFSSGGSSFLFAFVWAYKLVWQFHDDSQTMLPMFATPLRFARVVFSQSYRTKHPLCLGAWGLAAILAIFYVVGDPSFWWKNDKMSLALETMRFGMKPTDAHKGKRLKCQVMGYQESFGSLVAVVLAESREGKWRYVGSADQVSSTATNNSATALLPAYRRTSPVTPVPGVSALWVDPVLSCTVEFDEREPDGRLIDPIVVSWEKK
jgi:serine/threonine protein kinase